MLKIYLCRHGQDEDNTAGILNGHRDMPLTNVGREQAHELGQMAKDYALSFDKVYSSPLRRAKETAEIISRETGSPAPEELNNLIERDLGGLTGHPHSDILKLSKDFIQTDSVNYFLDIGESFPGTLARAKKVIDKVSKDNKNGNILLVTHGDIGKMIFAAFHNLTWQDVLKSFHFGNSNLLLLEKDSHHKPHVFVMNQRGLKEKA